MTQRIGIAQALVADPMLVVLDEPTSALDPVGRGEVRGLIGQLRAEGRAVILNSHLLGEVERVCDRVMVLDSGRTVFHGPIDELKGAPTGSRWWWTGSMPPWCQTCGVLASSPSKGRQSFI